MAVRRAGVSWGRSYGGGLGGLGGDAWRARQREIVLEEGVCNFSLCICRCVCVCVCVCVRARVRSHVHTCISGGQSALTGRPGPLRGRFLKTFPWGCLRLCLCPNALVSSVSICKQVSYNLVCRDLSGGSHYLQQPVFAGLGVRGL